jgi:hypothetical protein
MRPNPVRFAIFGTLALVAALTFSSLTLAQETDEFDSGGLGLTRSAWEETHGEGTLADVVSSPFDEIYGYNDGAYYVVFEGSKDPAESVALDVEAVWEGEGIEFEAAMEAVAGLLPADAERVGSPYFAVPTPDSPIGLIAWYYTSESLDAVPYGGPDSTLTPDILVTFHATYVDETPAGSHQQIVETYVTRASITTRLPEG